MTARFSGFAREVFEIAYQATSQPLNPSTRNLSTRNFATLQPLNPKPLNPKPRNLSAPNRAAFGRGLQRQLPAQY